MRRAVSQVGNFILEITTMAQTLFILDGETYREASAQDIIDRAATLIAQRFRAGHRSSTVRNAPGSTCSIRSAACRTKSSAHCSSTYVEQLLM